VNIELLVKQTGIEGVADEGDTESEANG